MLWFQRSVLGVAWWRVGARVSLEREWQEGRGHDVISGLGTHLKFQVGRAVSTLELRKRGARFCMYRGALPPLGVSPGIMTFGLCVALLRIVDGEAALAC